MTWLLIALPCLALLIVLALFYADLTTREAVDAAREVHDDR